MDHSLMRNEILITTFTDFPLATAVRASVVVFAGNKVWTQRQTTHGIGGVNKRQALIIKAE